MQGVDVTGVKSPFGDRQTDKRCRSCLAEGTETQEEESVTLLESCNRGKTWNSHVVQATGLRFKQKLRDDKHFHEVLIDFAVPLDIAFNVLQMFGYFTH